MTAAAVIALIFLTGCDSGNSNAGQFSDGEFSLGVPQRIRNISAIDLNNVVAVATVNDSVETKQYTMTLSNGRFRTQIQVAPNSTIRVGMEFSEEIDNGTETTKLILARHTEIDFQMNDSNETVQFSEADYNTNFDRDGDAITNIDERNLGTDPLVFSPIPTTRILNVSFNLPPLVPNPQVTQVIVTYGGAPKAVSRQSNRFEISGTAPTTFDLTIEVILIQNDNNNQRVVIATANEFVPAGLDTRTIQLASNDFDFNRDPDGDGRTNVEELRIGTDPFVAD